eukprot:gene3624-4514_t
MFNPFSPLKDEKLKEKNYGVKKEFSKLEIQEIQDNSYKKYRDRMIIDNDIKEVLYVGMWNPSGDNSNAAYKELRISIPIWIIQTFFEKAFDSMHGELWSM